MKLKRLVLEGFKSYKEKTIIDFTKMPYNQLFLILGKTGAGKSSILDAITFALYGEKSELINLYLTNSIKENLILNPENYKNQKIASVELEFEYLNKNYKIFKEIRVANFRKDNFDIKKHFEIQTKIFSDNNIENNIKNSELKFLNYLTKDQFLKSIIIPQNQFDKFLKADIPTKESILKKIFNTEEIDNFIEFLYNKIKSKKENLEPIKLVLKEKLNKNQIYKNIEDEDIENEFQSKIQHINKELDNIKKKIEQIKNLLKEKQHLLNQKQEQQKIYDDLEKVLKQYILEILHKQKEIQIKKQELDHAKEVSEIYPIYTNIKNLEEEIKKYNKEYKETENEYKKIINDILKENKNKEELNNKKSIMENIKHEVREKKEIIPKLKLFQRIQQEINQLEQNKKEKEKYLENIKKNLEDLKKQLEEFNSKLEIIYRHLFSKRLKKGEPCPVCGSKDHPSPYKGALAEEPESILQKKKNLEKEIQEIEKKIQMLEKEIKEIEKKIHNKEMEIESIKKYLEKKQYDLSHIYEVEKQLEKETKKQEQEIKEYENQFSQNINNLNNLSQLQGKLEGKQKQLEQNIQNSQIKLEKDKNDLQNLFKKIHIKEEEIEKFYRSKEDIQVLEEEINQYLEKKNHLLGQWEGIYRRLSSLKIDVKIEDIYKISKEELDLELKEILQRNKNIQKELLDLEKEIKDLEEKSTQKNQEMGRIKEKLDEISKDLNEFKETKKDYQKITQDLMLYESIYNIISNKNPKNISFHRFILQAYFEMMIQNANERLIKIEPRYRLKASEDAEYGKRLAGLNIKVMDQWEGERSIESLSGGETFYVSLALALGLYDSIHMNISNVQFDFLFIDEGFGSLDEETLQKVLKTIKEVFLDNHYNSQKQVGLISHVESMKKQIPYQIIIENINGSSKVAYRY